VIKDRGNIKWTSLMLTEHRDLLKKLLEEENNADKAELDEQIMEEMDYLLNTALSTDLIISIIYYSQKRYFSFCGKIKNYNPYKGEIILFNDKELKKLNLRDIIGIKL
jgi:hypothetical protein